MAEKTKDLYGVLGVESTATKKEIKKSYRKLAAEHHPDVSKEPDAVENFKRISEAYEVLMDDESRKEYDAFVAAVNEGKMSFDDLVDTFHHDIPRAFAPLEGETVEIEMEFTVAEVRQEAKKQLTFTRYVNCEDCEGHGFIAHLEDVCRECNGESYQLKAKQTPFGTIQAEERCASCEGTGYERREKCDSCKSKGKKEKPVKVTFQIPKGATEGFEYTLKHKGDDGINGGKNGDLKIKFVQSPTDPFTIQYDYDVRINLDVPFLTSMTGGSVKMEMPNGEIKKVPVTKGTSTGHQIILPNEGLFNKGNGFYGNVVAVVNVLPPKKLSETHMKKMVDILK